MKTRLVSERTWPQNRAKNYTNESKTHESLHMGGESEHVKQQERQQIFRQVEKICCLQEQWIFQSTEWPQYSVAPVAIYM